jgi:hypothetical protein
MTPPDHGIAPALAGKEGRGIRKRSKRERARRMQRFPTIRWETGLAAISPKTLPVSAATARAAW